MKKIVSTFINTFVIVIVITGAFIVSTYALAQKLNSYQKTSTVINGLVEKKQTVVIAKTRGNIVEIHPAAGERVETGEVLAKLDNPDLVSRVDSLAEFKNNLSAQTELQLAKNEMENLTVVSPVTGYIDEIKHVEGESVNTSDMLFSIYNNENTRVYAILNDVEYKQLRAMNTVKVYNERLNQYMDLRYSALSPARTMTQNHENKIGVYFTLLNKDDGENLLHNETMLFISDRSQNSQIEKPFETITRIWNTVLNH